MQVKIKKLREGAKLPTRGTAGSAGADLYACIDESVTINPGDLKLIPTGIAIALPDFSVVAYLYARSGLGVKHGICLSRSASVFATFQTCPIPSSRRSGLLRWLSLPSSFPSLRSATNWTKPSAARAVLAPREKAETANRQIIIDLKPFLGYNTKDVLCEERS